MSTTFSTLAAENGVGSSSAIDTRRLEPQDAHYLSPPDRKLGPGVTRKRRERTRSSSRQRKGNYKKLLWFKQPFPDNYTDEKTFLDHLKRNPSLRPYEFWSLMADSTVIIQHLSSVAIFSCCFVAIIQKRVSPISVVTWASGCTVLAWILWDYWLGQDETEVAETAIMDQVDEAKEENKTEGPKSTSISGGSDLNRRHSNVGPNRSQKELPPMSPASATSGHRTLYVDPASSLSPRNQQRLATAKSALLIYAALLGLSPILKSLTKSTTSDSIWALSTWLLMMNVAFFDYRSGAGSQLPASISTNSAMMASTVLASRLDSTTHVFSLTLFSIEVFGLFPIFRRQLRAKSRYGHLALTLALVIASSGGVFMTLTGGGRSTFIAGVILGGFITFFCMAICCWWLIGLQKYKNEIHGPWDPAKPVIRRRYD